MTERKTRSRLTGGIIAVIVLAVCLVVTTVALAYSIASVRDNTFATGGIRINLNDGEPVIRPDEFLFEPGMTVKKDFFIENDSTGTVYYRLYFAGVSGDLADVLEVADERWRGAVEGYLHTQKFYLLVDPAYYKQALSIFDRLKKEFGAMSFGLVDVGKLRERETIHPRDDSLAKKVATENQLARSYIDYLLGRVVVP